MASTYTIHYKMDEQEPHTCSTFIISFIGEIPWLCGDVRKERNGWNSSKASSIHKVMTPEGKKMVILYFLGHRGLCFQKNNLHIITYMDRLYMTKREREREI